jgi:hypothetical protein
LVNNDDKGISQQKESRQYNGVYCFCRHCSTARRLPPDQIVRYDNEDPKSKKTQLMGIFFGFFWARILCGFNDDVTA